MTDYRRLFDLTGKTAVVLGAASGIGKSSAEALANLGARVLCADRDLDRCEATAAGIRAAGGWAEAMSDRRCAGQRRRIAGGGGEGQIPAHRHRRHDAGTEYPQNDSRLHRGGP